MARAGYRIFDADTHIIEAAEPIEAYLSAADKARLAALGSLVAARPGKGGVSRYRVGKRPELNRLLGSRDKVPTAEAISRGLKDGGTPWDVRWQGPPFPRRPRELRFARADPGHGHRGRRREHGPAVGRAGRVQRPGRRQHRDDDVSGVSPLPQGLLRALSDRLTSVLHVTVRDVASSVAEIRRCGKETWPAACPVCPPGMTLDDPDWDPIWARRRSTI